MQNDKSIPKSETVTQQETGGDCVSRLVLRWEDLPLIVDETEHNGEWSRKVERVETVGSLLEIWDINDESDHSAMAQVLRYHREYFQQNAESIHPESKP